MKKGGKLGAVSDASKGKVVVDERRGRDLSLEPGPTWISTQEPPSYIARRI